MRRDIEMRALRERQREIEREIVDFAAGYIKYEDLSPVVKAMADDLIAARKAEAQKEQKR